MIKYFLYSGVILLIILHQDFWLWDNNNLLFSFLPVGLAYHMGISIAAVLLWALICRFCWPKNSDDK